MGIWDVMMPQPDYIACFGITQEVRREDSSKIIFDDDCLCCWEEGETLAAAMNEVGKCLLAEAEKCQTT